MAEGVGFEPTVPCSTAVFKCVSVDSGRKSLLVTKGCEQFDAVAARALSCIVTETPQMVGVAFRSPSRLPV